MASKDNQNLQIIIIVLALGFIGMSVGLLFVNNSRKTAEARADKADEQAKEANKDERELQTEANTYKQYMGVDEADTYETVQKTFEEDMAEYAGSFEESSQKYRTILQIISEENDKLALSELAAKQREQQLNGRLLSLQKETKGQIAEFSKAANQAQQELASEQNKFRDQYTQINAEKNEIADQLAEKREQIDDMAAKHSETQELLNIKITKLERVIEILKNNQAIPDPYAQPADGLVRWVNQREGKVRINLGEMDHLRPQVTFSVYSSDANDVNGAQSKASVEVTRIIGAHMAEARITSDQATRPIVEGDKVYSQVWNRGRQVGFAITGVIDFDGDGRSDLDQLRGVIELNNGKIDAVPGEDGTIDGEMTVDTRYLILGKYPDDARRKSNAIRDAWQVMNDEANTLNIEGITLNEFLSLMGWNANAKTVKLGTGARGIDFPARAQGDYRPRDIKPSKDQFRTRKAPPSY